MFPTLYLFKCSPSIPIRCPLSVVRSPHLRSCHMVKWLFVPCHTLARTHTHTCTRTTHTELRRKWTYSAEVCPSSVRSSFHANHQIYSLSKDAIYTPCAVVAHEMLPNQTWRPRIWCAIALLLRFFSFDSHSFLFIFIGSRYCAPMCCCYVRCNENLISVCCVVYGRLLCSVTAFWSTFILPGTRCQFSFTSTPDALAVRMT